MTQPSLLTRLMTGLRGNAQTPEPTPTPAPEQAAPYSDILNVARGRIYVRDITAFPPRGGGDKPSSPGAQLVFGIARLPSNVIDERCYGARLDDRGLTFNFKFAHDLAVPPFVPDDAPPPSTPLSDFTISNILRFFAFRQAAAQDCLEMFLRKSPLPCDEPDHSWFFVAGPALSGFACQLPRGLYDLASRPAFKQTIETADYHQLTPTEVFAEPLWGDSSNLGLLSDYKVGCHTRAEAARRRAISSDDPAFERFCEMLDEEVPPVPFYTTDEFHARRAKLGELAARVNVNLGAPTMGSAMPDLPGLVASVKAATLAATATKPGNSRRNKPSR